jgi:hypothetical protein
MTMASHVRFPPSGGCREGFSEQCIITKPLPAATLAAAPPPAGGSYIEKIFNSDGFSLIAIML